MSKGNSTPNEEIQQLPGLEHLNKKESNEIDESLAPLVQTISDYMLKHQTEANIPNVA